MLAQHNQGEGTSDVGRIGLKRAERNERIGVKATHVQVWMCVRATNRPPNWDMLLSVQVPSRCNTPRDCPPAILPGSRKPCSLAQGHVDKDTP